MIKSYQKMGLCYSDSSSDFGSWDRERDSARRRAVIKYDRRKSQRDYHPFREHSMKIEGWRRDLRMH